ncbi:transposase, partial [Escherichia coli]|nr:transposase [Escherichia coli]
VLESQDEYDSQWAAICSIAPKIGCKPETLRVWVRQHERDTGGGDGGLTSAERQRLKELERENSELRRSNDILPSSLRWCCRCCCRGCSKANLW